MMEQSITFWQAPNAQRYDRLVRENIIHVGRTEGFKAIADFVYSNTAYYITLSHDNIDILLSLHDDMFIIVEWSKHLDDNGLVQKENRLNYTLSDWPLIEDLAKYLSTK
jgi:hypothetical protein